MAANNKFSHAFTLELSEKVQVGNKKVHKKVGEVKVPVPTLADFGIEAKQYIWKEDDAKQNKEAVAGQAAFNNGVPVYDDPKADWLQGAIVKAVAAASRNKFTKGELKPGQSLAEDFEALTAETQRTGEALALRREAKASFEQYLAKLGKKQVTIQQLSELFFNSAKVLASAGEKYIEALGRYTGEWLDTLNDAEKARFAPKINELQESLNNAAQQSDLDDDLA